MGKTSTDEKHHSVREKVFIQSFNEVSEGAYKTAVEKGWFDNDPDEANLICGMHAELSEALSGARDGDPQSSKIPGFTVQEEEFGDVFLRVMTYARLHNLRIPEAMLAKAKYNKDRPYRHGNKLF